MRKLTFLFILIALLAAPARLAAQENSVPHGQTYSFDSAGQLLDETVYFEGDALSARTFADYRTLPPYRTLLNRQWTAEEKDELLNILSSVKTSEKLCADERDIYRAHLGNICGAEDRKRLNDFFRNKAEWLADAALAYLNVSLHDTPTLFVSIQTGNFDKYTGIYQISLTKTGLSIQFYGPFLAGTIYYFSKDNKLFIRHQSCMECHPWIYLTVIVFDPNSQNIGVPLHFDYALNNLQWAPHLEYALPGKGHSVDGIVQTRLMTTGPYAFMQKFTLEGDKTEWWAFECPSFKCITTLKETATLPEDWQGFWDSGLPITADN